MKKNSHISTSSRASGALRLRENGQDSGRPSSARKNRSVKKSSKNIGRKSLSFQKSGTLTEQNGKGQPYSPEVSPANLFPMPGSEEARKMTAISGQKCSELYWREGPVGCLLRMCLESSKWHSTRCFLTWKMKVMPQKYLLFRLVPSMPRTGGIEFGLLPTAQRSLGGPSKNPNNPRGIQAGKPLETLIAILPTPTKRDWKGRCARSNRGIIDDLPHKIEGNPNLGTKTGMKL